MDPVLFTRCKSKNEIRATSGDRGRSVVGKFYTSPAEFECHQCVWAVWATHWSSRHLEKNGSAHAHVQVSSCFRETLHGHQTGIQICSVVSKLLTGNPWGRYLVYSTYLVYSSALPATWLAQRVTTYIVQISLSTQGCTSNGTSVLRL